MSAYRCRVAEAMTAAREAAGVSQRELADRLGRDKRTIQKWEKGEMKIAMEDFLAVFDALKVQVEPYSKWIRHPELFPNGLSDILQYYFLFADHGSDYHGMYQQWMANLLTPLRDRRRICAQIIENYNEALATGTITDPDAPQPNMEVLQACYEASAQSIQNGANSYTMLSLDLPHSDTHA